MAKKGTFPANAMRRGEIYWVDIPNAIGHELMKDRPAIIVSCDALNDNSPVVQVVYCSASPKKELPEHITIRSTEQISTALCENVYTVDKSRVGRYVGRCTKREMEQVDLGLLSGPVRPCKPPGGRGGAGAGTRGHRGRHGFHGPCNCPDGAGHLQADV